MKRNFRELLKIFLGVFIFVSIMSVIYWVNDSVNSSSEKSYQQDTLSGFMDKIKQNQIRVAHFDDKQAKYKTTSGYLYKTEIPQPILKDIINALYKNNTLFDYTSSQNNSKTSGKEKKFSISDIIWEIITFLILIFILRAGMGSGSNKSNIISSSKNTPIKSDVKFSDVAGIDAYKNEVVEIVDFLKNPEKYNKYGAKIPKGVLLCGPPGTGKTLVARAMAGEANVPFFSVAGSDFVEMFVGLGAARVRELFKSAEKYPAAIIFIDELDAIGRSRKDASVSSNSEQTNTLNAILVAMDGFSKNNIVVIGATNRSEILDSALLRPGRFDRIVNVPLPDMDGREAIAQLYLNKVKIPYLFTAKDVAIASPGFSGAEISNLINETILCAIRDNAAEMTKIHLSKAQDKVLAGVPDARKHDPHDLITTAYHESGHAYIAYLLHKKGLFDPIYKLTIESHGSTLGFLMHLPEKDSTHDTKAHMLSHIKVALAGRAAEEVFFGIDRVSSGAYSDFKKATNIAHNMVRRFGMSENGHLIMEGEDYGNSMLISEKMKETLYYAAKDIVSNAYNEVVKILTENKEIIHRLTYYLMVNKTLYRNDVDTIVKGVYTLIGKVSSINILNNSLTPFEDHKVLL